MWERQRVWDWHSEKLTENERERGREKERESERDRWKDESRANVL
jgi:hypothetical protein